MVKVQAEVKKAWLRRSLALDLKQKARVAGGSCYYGGTTSHATTQSICLGVPGSTASRGPVAVALRGPSQSTNPHGYSAGHAETTLPMMQHPEEALRPNGGREEELYFVPEDHSGSESLKDLETNL